jgi:plasmid stabilization system protein ParE
LSSHLPARLVRRAVREIEEASEWWEANRPASPGAVTEEVRKALRLICSAPHVGARAMNVSLHGVRRLHLSRIHYHLYYRVLTDPPCVEVLALWHTRRGSGPGF